jgi:hypothetical protein
MFQRFCLQVPINQAQWWFQFRSEFIPHLWINPPLEHVPITGLRHRFVISCSWVANRRWTKAPCRHWEIVQRLREHGFKAYFVGGCVRLLMGRGPKDYDITTDATPDRVMALFPDNSPWGTVRRGGGTP